MAYGALWPIGIWSITVPYASNSRSSICSINQLAVRRRAFPSEVNIVVPSDPEVPSRVSSEITPARLGAAAPFGHGDPSIDQRSKFVSRRTS
jgi:hypothetical protein